MRKELISIIVPVYNVEKYIKRCIKSVQQQIYSNWELILIDDGSSDKSLSICRDYEKKDHRIKVFSQSNAGVSSARNRGLNQASGHYVTFIDGDDYWMDVNYLKTIVLSIDKDVIYSPNLVLQYPNGAIRKENGASYLHTNEVNEKPALFLASNMKRNRWGCVFFVIKKSIIDQNNTRFNESILIGEDADWVFRVLLNAQNMVILDKTNYVYRVNRLGSAMTVKHPESILSFFKMIKLWKIDANNDSNIIPIYRMFCNNAMDYYHTFGLYNNEDQTRLINSLIESGAYDDSNSIEAERIRRKVNRFGHKMSIFQMGVFYKIKLKIGYIKRKLMR